MAFMPTARDAPIGQNGGYNARPFVSGNVWSLLPVAAFYFSSPGS